MSALDSDQLISTALKRLGNETLAADAFVWLLNILDRLYEDFKWPFLENTETGALAVGQSSVDLPADFDAPWDVNSFVLIDSNGSHHPLRFNTQYDQDWLSNPSLTGTPTQAIVDLASQTWRPYPLPERAYTWQVRYRMLPVREDENFTPTFPNDEILIQAIYVRGLQHEDDDRYGAEMNELQRMIARYKAKFNLQPIKNQKVRFSSRFGTPESFR